jgi:hypothetical protein
MRTAQATLSFGHKVVTQSHLLHLHLTRILGEEKQSVSLQELCSLVTLYQLYSLEGDFQELESLQILNFKAFNCLGVESY